MYKHHATTRLLMGKPSSRICGLDFLLEKSTRTNPHGLSRVTHHLNQTKRLSHKAKVSDRSSGSKFPSLLHGDVHYTRNPLRVMNTQLDLYHRRSSYGTVSGKQEQPIIHDVFENNTGTWQYVVADPSTSVAVIIDPVLDYDPVTQAITTASADALLSMVTRQGYRVDKILETHAHADHLTAASYLQQRLANQQGTRPAIGIGRRIGTIQQKFGQRYGVPAEELEGVFDRLFEDDEVFDIGNLKATAIHLPGHTPDHLGYRIGGNCYSISPEGLGSADNPIRQCFLR